VLSGNESPRPVCSAPVIDASWRPAELAVFLDVDGTLIEIAEAPDAVIVGQELLNLLRALVLRTQGAVALISGRSIATLDALFEPLLLPSAGMHGFERRDAQGLYCRRELPPGEVLQQVRRLLGKLVARDSRLLLEDKRFALAVHYRHAPELEATVLEEVAAIARKAGSGLEMQRGRMVVELRPAGANKADAIADFMREAPFAGRRPLCLGDDLTDECAFEWVNAAGGMSLAVGVTRPTAATAHLSSVSAARGWLRQLVEQPP
jgi:trehalose 6-phosphate phosphatase